MNDNQSLTNTSGNQLSQTGNPQIIGGQALAPVDSSLQTSSGSVLSLPNVTIKSVGSTNFQPVNVLAASTKASSDIPQPTVSSTPKTLFIGIGIAIVFLAIIVVIAIRNGQKPVRDAKENI